MSLSGMTGFGAAEGAASDLRWRWEARSVNGRGLDVKLRLPPAYERLEAPARDALQARFRRGSVQAALTVKREAARGATQIDFAALEALIAAAKPYVARGEAAPPAWHGLLSVRGVVVSAEEIEPDEEARAALDRELLAGFAVALDALDASRRDEGANLRRVMVELVARIAEGASNSRSLAAAQPAAILERVKARLAGLAAEVAIDPQRLAQEAALIASRADVAEELERLSAHAEEAASLLAGSGPIGRRLDFLTQEMMREANTLSAKSGDLALTRASLDLKSAIDQLKEQAANVE